MSTLTKAEALALMEKINQANHQKKPYVRVDGRLSFFHDIVDCDYCLFSYVNVYSKTWSRRVAKLVPMKGEIKNRNMLNLREARKILV
jgi:hypothetical protein